MTPRARYRETLHFGTPDRVPLTPGTGRRSTLRAWHEQGLPPDVAPEDVVEFAYRQAGGTLPWPRDEAGFPVSERMIPAFEEKILEERATTRIVQDWKGNICEISNQYPVEYLRNPVDFVTRRWLRCPVQTRADWEQMQARYDPDDPARLPANAAALSAALRDRTWPITLQLAGPFWQLREWLGFEALCTVFCDDPEFVRDMIEFWRTYVSRLLANVLRVFVPDEVHLSEDIAYKQAAMISPAMAREFLLPTWREWGAIVRAAGVPLYGMDSDGFVGELLPLWIEAGFTHCDPIEVAAENDLAAYRAAFGHRIAFVGGVDKRAMAKGGASLQAEIARIAPIVRDGGYIPSCDHGVPPDVSWPNYVLCTKLLAELTGWL